MDQIQELNQHEETSKTLQINKIVRSTRIYEKKEFIPRCKNYKLWQESWEAKGNIVTEGINPKTKIIRKQRKEEEKESIKSEKPIEKNLKNKEIVDSSEKHKKIEGFYKVTRIVDTRITSDGKNEYKVRWKGFSSKDDTWEPEENFDKESLDELLENEKDEIRQNKNMGKNEKNYLTSEKESIYNKIILNNLNKVKINQTNNNQNQRQNDKVIKKTVLKPTLTPMITLSKCSLKSYCMERENINNEYFNCEKNECQSENIKKTTENIKTKEMEILETMNFNSENSFEQQKQQKNKNNDNMYELKDIISRRIIIHKGKKQFRYRIRWVGYGPKDDTWEEAENLNEIDVEKFDLSLIPPAPKAEDNNLEKEKKREAKYKPSKFCEIVDDRIEKGKTLFKIHWKGYKSEEDTWEPITNFNFGSQLLLSYEKKLGKMRKDNGILNTMPSLREPIPRETLHEIEKEGNIQSEVSEHCSNNIDEEEHYSSFRFSEKNLEELIFFPNLLQVRQQSEEEQLIEYKEISEKHQMEDENEIWKCI